MFSGPGFRYAEGFLKTLDGDRYDIREPVMDTPLGDFGMDAGDG